MAYPLMCVTYTVEDSCNVNYVRYQLSKRGKYDEELLLPNQDSLDQYIRRANFPCYIWRHAMQPMLNLPSFYNRDWEVNESWNLSTASTLKAMAKEDVPA